MNKYHSSVPFRTKLNADKVIGLILSCTPIRKYRGAIENYIRWSMNTLRSEGIQAQERLKSYREYLTNCVSCKEVTYPPRGKYRKLLPLLRILDDILTANDMLSMRWLMTIMRIHELAAPSQKFLDQELRDFVFKMDPEAQPVDRDPKVINRRRKLENYKDILRREEAQYPNFPWQEFKDWLKPMEENLHQHTIKMAARPHIAASFLSKSSSSEIDINRQGEPKFKSIPSIVMADLEYYVAYRRYSENNEPTDKAYALAKAILRSLKLDQSYEYNPCHDVFIDKEGLNAFVDEYVLYYRIKTVAIPASNSIKARIIHKTAYPIQYPLQLLNDTSMKLIREIPGDYSASHEDGFRTLNDYARQGDFLADVDATAWTDNFPLAFQYHVVKARYGEEVAGLWVEVMRSPIHVELAEPDGSRQLYEYRIRTGQTMGSFFSWVAAADSHHFLIRFSYHRVNSKVLSLKKVSEYLSYKVFEKPYWEIGDDEVSSDPVAQSMYVTLSASLGIRLNSEKSKVMSVDNGRYMAEIAHRQTLRGIEVTGVSPKLVSNSLQSYSQLVVFLRFLRQRHVGLDEDLLISRLVKESTTLSRHQYRRKYGQYPIPRRWIEIGLELPSCVGGLVPDDTNWNLRINPQLLLVAMLSTISSYITMFRPGNPILRDGRSNADEILQSVQYLPDNLMNIGRTLLSKYERQTYADKLNQLYIREVTSAIQTLMSDNRLTFAKATLANYEYVDMEYFKAWFTSTLDGIKSIAGVPAYLAREYESRAVRETMRKIDKLSPRRFTSREAWIDKLNLSYRDLLDRLDYLSHSFYEKKNKASKEEDLAQMYEALFGF
nr:RNA-dependent RNA polymerase [Mitovirus sp.]